MVRNGVFRDGAYARYVMFGKRTVKAGECLSIWKLNGRQRVIQGPRRKYLWRCNIRFLDRYQADQRQYLVIVHRDGRREHRRGPIFMYEDPVLHQRIEVKDVISVDGFEALVVYRSEQTGVGKAAVAEAGAVSVAVGETELKERKDENKGEVERRIIRGPTQFMPDANEWVHEFSWHGAPAGGDKEILIPGANKFTKLRTIPDQIYAKTEVRTYDDVLLTLKLIVFYEMSDIETLLNSTSDPIGDMINALGADLITFAAKVSYAKFLEVSAVSLNDSTTFPLLNQRAGSIGFTISKVVYRGYAASRDIQEMHESTVKTSAQLKLNHETAIKSQELEDLVMARNAARAEQARAIAAAEHGERMRQQEVEHEALMRQKQLELEMSELSIKRTNEEKISFLGKAKDLGVDLTKYLVSEHTKIDKVIKVETPQNTNSTLLINTK